MSTPEGGQSRNHRTQYVIPPDLREFIRQESFRRNVSKSKLVRIALRTLRGDERPDED